jgi:type I restriction enzyme, S subunit
MSHVAYPAYKDSGIEWLGVIPEHWEVLRLRFQAKINPSRSELNNRSESLNVSFIPMESIHEYGGLTLDQMRSIAEVSTGYTYFIDGDVITAKITPCFENGKGAIAENLINGIGFGTTELHVLRPRTNLNSRFLFYVTISHPFRHLGAAEMYGAGGQKRVPEDFVKDFRQPIPLLPEQRAIAAFLDRETVRIDGLIEKKQRQIELLQEKRAALISHAVTKGLNPNAKMKDSGIEWLGEIPAHWSILQLRRVVCRFVDYRGRTPTKTESGIPLITAGAVKDGRIDHSLAPEYIAEQDYVDWMCRGMPELGDIVITTEAPLGEVAQVYDAHVAFAQRVILFKVNRKLIIPEFLRYYYLSQNGKSELLSRASGSTASGIRSDRLRMSLVVVPLLDEQQRIVDLLNQTLDQLSAPLKNITDSINLLREYRTALISAAVTGKIDVRGEDKLTPSRRATKEK